MKFINNINITKKLVIAFSLLLVFAVGLGLFSLSRVRLLGAINAQTVANVGVSVRLASMRRDAADMQGLASQDALAQDGSVWGTIRDEEKGVRKDFGEQWELYQATMMPGRETADGNKFNAAFQKLTTLAIRAGKMIAVGNSQMAGDIVLTDMAAAYTDFQNAIADDLAYPSKRPLQMRGRPGLCGQASSAS